MGLDEMLSGGREMQPVSLHDGGHGGLHSPSQTLSDIDGEGDVSPRSASLQTMISR